jgi:GNAT superfamily N-acetyltransferase
MLHDFNEEFDSPTPEIAVLAERLSRLLTRDDLVVLLGGDPAVAVALLTLRPTPWASGPVGLLEELYVRPSHRAHGLGSAVLRRACETCRDSGAEELQINVDEVDVDARRFYERHGFTNVEPGQPGRMLFYYRDL